MRSGRGNSNGRGGKGKGNGKGGGKNKGKGRGRGQQQPQEFAEQQFPQQFVQQQFVQQQFTPQAQYHQGVVHGRGGYAVPMHIMGHQQLFVPQEAITLPQTMYGRGGVQQPGGMYDSVFGRGGGKKGGGKKGNGDGKKGNTGKNRTVEHEENAALLSLLKAFKEGKEESMELANLNPRERLFLHEQCSIHNLAHKSSGKETARVLTISKKHSEDLTTEDFFQREEVNLDSIDPATIDTELAEYEEMGIFERKIAHVPNLKRNRPVFNFSQSKIKANHGKRNVSPYITAFRKELPAAHAKHHVVGALRQTNVVIISGETGSGKTTQVPQFIIDEKNLIPEGKGILVTQPRRISATSVAGRIAEERGSHVGAEVGYRVRFDGKVSDETKIMFVTTGVLVRMLEDRSVLNSIGCIILDEVHERNAETDFCIMILKMILKSGADLKLILMSATLSSSLFKDYFADLNPKIVAIKGTTFPIQHNFLSETISQLDIPPPNRTDVKKMTAAISYAEKTGGSDDLISRLQSSAALTVDHLFVYRVIEKIVNSSRKGGILVFLPGWRDITTLAELVRQSHHVAKKVKIARCHSSLSSDEQAAVFKPPPGGLRKVVLATNIAETSITIPDVVFVIDTCLTKQSSYCPLSDVVALSNCTISQAAVLQRRGRAGRTSPGVCYTLIEKSEFDRLPAQTTPEIKRIPLGSLCLQLTSLGFSPVETLLTAALEPPSEEAVVNAMQFLTNTGALTGGKLTNLGKVLSRFPLDPLIGKLVLSGIAFRVMRPICIIAAFLSCKSPFLKAADNHREASNEAKRRYSRGEHSDHTMCLAVFEDYTRLPEKDRPGFCSSMQLDHRVMKQIQNTTQQLTNLAKQCGYMKGGGEEVYNRNSENTGLVRGVLFAGLYPNIGWVGVERSVKTGKIRGGKCAVFTMDGKRAKIGGDSVNGGPEVKSHNLAEKKLSYLVYYETILLESEFVISDVTLFGPNALLLFSPNARFSTATDVHLPNDWRIFSLSPDWSTRLQRLRHLTYFFWEKSLERVDASIFPDSLVASISAFLEYPLGLPPAPRQLFEFSDDESEECDGNSLPEDYEPPEIIEDEEEVVEKVEGGVEAEGGEGATE